MVSSRGAQPPRDFTVAICAVAKDQTLLAEDAICGAEAIERPRGPSARFASLGMTYTPSHRAGNSLAAASAHPIILRSPECVRLDASGRFVVVFLFHGQHD